MSEATAPDLYEVDLITVKDGATVSEYAKKMLTQHGAIFDEHLGGFVMAGGMPMSYMAFLPMNNLTAREIEIDYDVRFFHPRTPMPSFAALNEAWCGPPVNDFSAYFSWFQIAGAEPFAGLWDKERQEWSARGYVSPSQAVANGWRFLATAAESIDMAAYLADVAIGQHLSKARVEDIEVGLTDAALQVAIVRQKI
jgi:hypothetical protein